MLRKFLPVLVLALLAGGVSAESLWKDDGGLYGSRRFKPGDTLKIAFRNKQIIEFTSFQEDYASASLNNPNKSASMVLNFLPQLQGDAANSSQKKARTKNQNNLNFSILCRVVTVESNGGLRVSGGHRMVIDNQVETVQIEGLVDPGRITGDIVLSEDVLDLNFVYNRNSYKPDLFNDADFENITSGSNLGMSDTKKRELLLRYFNQVVPLLFR